MDLNIIVISILILIAVYLIYRAVLKINRRIILTEEFNKILDLLNNTNQNLFISGKAGTGKSTLLKYFTENTNKKFVVLAPTGVAALNVKRSDNSFILSISS
ncbi:MAG: AAA family ATPase [Ignavibacteria bacterium]|nr:AAA family ATPase [Ignavibacteria bacterium]